MKGGLVVHVGCGDGKLTAALRANDSFVVQGLDADVTAARENIRAAGVYGPVSAAAWAGGRLPYADNTVNLLLVSDPKIAIAENEVDRALAPRGVVLIGGRQIVKPWPSEKDDWTHYLYDASNNAVSHDRAVAQPRHTQWLSHPLWSRDHEKMSSFSVMVSAQGRLFMVADHQSPASMALPPDWRLTARDAFSGVRLWERPMPEWWPTMFGFKSGPANLTRRLVAVGDRLFVTLGIRAPLSVLDAATGKTLATWEDTRDCEEIIVEGPTAFVTAHDPAAYPKIRLLNLPTGRPTGTTPNAAGRPNRRSPWRSSRPGRPRWAASSAA